ncbi:MAG TPA: TPM domain-containing protein [Verrucomicrobiae bacterium]|nr:TPM domain-containing protein [Verrucomicrobiae bacterium]
MKAPQFIQQLREPEIVAAIRAAELKTSGELRVFISRKDVADPVAAAQKEFTRLGMTKTRDRNAVLIYLAPRTQKFAVIGDQGVHARCGDTFWQELARSMTEHFRKGEFTEGIVQGIKRAGELLGQHFPRRPDDSNELPNRVERD